MNIKSLIQRAKRDAAAPVTVAPPEEWVEDIKPLPLPTVAVKKVCDSHLVGADVLRSVWLVEDWLPPEAEVSLLRRFRERERDFTQLRGKRTARYGGDPGPPFVPETLPSWLEELCQALDVALGNADIQPLNHVLVNHYKAGEGILPHKDGPAYSPRAGILSLGSAVVFEFWRDHAHAASGSLPSLQVLIPPRSLLVFSDEAYNSHLHGIAARPHDALRGIANWTPATIARWLLAQEGHSQGTIDSSVADEKRSAWATLQLEDVAHGQSEDASLRRMERYSLTVRHVPLPRTASMGDSPMQKLDIL